MGLMRCPQRKASRWAKSRHRGGQATPPTRRTRQPSNHEIWGPNDFSRHASNRQGAPSCWRHTSRLPTLPVAVLTPIPLRRLFDHMFPISHCSSLTPLNPLKFVDAIPLHTARYVHFDTQEWNIPHYFELKTHLFKHLSETKIRDSPKFEMPFFTLRKSPERHDENKNKGKVSQNTTSFIGC